MISPESSTLCPAFATWTRRSCAGPNLLSIPSNIWHWQWEWQISISFVVYTPFLALISNHTLQCFFTIAERIFNSVTSTFTTCWIIVFASKFWHCQFYLQCNVHLDFLFLEAEYKVAIVLVVIRLPTATIAISTACQASSSWLSPSHYQRLNDLGEKVNKEMTFSPFLVSFTSSQRQFLANFSAVFFLSRYKQLLHSLCKMISSRDFEINDDGVSQVG